MVLVEVDDVEPLTADACSEPLETIAEFAMWVAGMLRLQGVAVKVLSAY
jgi:hypothetical protein